MPIETIPLSRCLGRVSIYRPKKLSNAVHKSKPVAVGRLFIAFIKWSLYTTYVTLNFRITPNSRFSFLSSASCLLITRQSETSKGSLITRELEFFLHTCVYFRLLLVSISVLNYWRAACMRRAKVDAEASGSGSRRRRGRLVRAAGFFFSLAFILIEIRN